MKSISSLESNKVKNVIVVYDCAFVNGGAAKVAIQSAIGLSRKFHVCFFATVGPICEELKNSNVEVKCLEGNDINSGSRIRAAVECICNSYAAKAFKEILRQYGSQDTVVHIHGWAKALSSSIISMSRVQAMDLKRRLHCMIILHCVRMVASITTRRIKFANMMICHLLKILH